ncbi:MAG TPA: sulfite exporter TauE/SafE family protein [Acidobacteriota bacterium]|nr:sulfite exporter TauE/SafE family protein [Acidobacteriota bacterium]
MSFQLLWLSFFTLREPRSSVHCGGRREKRMKVGYLTGGLAIGVAAGILAGMVGVGGGIIIVPALLYFFKMDQHTAQGTSLAVLLPPTGLLAFLRYYKAGHVDVGIALVMIVGVLLGGYFGGGWAQELSGTALRKGFAVFMFVVALNMFFQK